MSKSGVLWAVEGRSLVDWEWVPLEFFSNREKARCTQPGWREWFRFTRVVKYVRTEG